MEIQRAAYAIEAELIGFAGIPQLTETAGEVRELAHLRWTGAFVDGLLIGLIAWEDSGDNVDIDRLAVDPRWTRQGFARRLVRTVRRARTTTVSTGEKNLPAMNLYVSEGFEQFGSREVAPDVRLALLRRVS